MQILDHSLSPYGNTHTGTVHLTDCYLYGTLIDAYNLHRKRIMRQKLDIA